MKTIKEIRADLRDIRYYFSRKKSFDKLSGLNIRCEIEEKIKYYNNLMVMANPNLIDLYVNFSRQKPQTNPPLSRLFNASRQIRPRRICIRRRLPLPQII